MPREYSTIKADVKEESVRQRLWDLTLGKERNRKTFSSSEMAHNNYAFNQGWGGKSGWCGMDTCTVPDCTDALCPKMLNGNWGEGYTRPEEGENSSEV